MSVHSTRAWILFEQGQFDRALQEAVLALADEPDDESMHAIASLCATRKGQREAGRAHALESVRAAPNSSFAHYALAASYFEGNRYDDALASIQNAIQIDVEDPNFRAFQASVLMSMKRYEDAVAAASEGLVLDPEHVWCLNLLAQGQMALGRKGQASVTVREALAEQPDDDGTHANTGWVYLRQGNPRQARTHFVEALRINPENDWARSGLAEALKAKNVFYRLMLKWYFWVGGMSSNVQWGLIVGLWILFRLSHSLGESNPALAPWLLPLQIVYVVLCLGTWLADPIFNLVLMLDREGRYALSARARRGAVAVGLLLLFGALNLTLHFTTAVWHETGLVTAFVSLVACAPMHAAFAVAEGWPTRVAKAAATFLVLCVLAMFLLPAVASMWPATTGSVAAIFVPLMWTAGIASIAALWGTNFLAQAEPRY